MRRIFIADPSLKDIRGHHFELTKKISETFTENSEIVVWLTNKKFKISKKKLKDSVNVVPIFTSGTYDKFVKAKNLKIDRLKIVQKVMLKIILKITPVSIKSRIKKGLEYIKMLYFKRCYLK